MRTLILSTIVLLSACSATLSDYEKSSPEFIFEDYFSGELIAWGMIQDYQQKLTRHFCVEIQASWSDKNGQLEAVIDEQFYFNDGETDRRIWRISKNHSKSNTYYTGYAGDVEGLASGASAGNAFQWQYRLQIPLRKSDGSVSSIDIDIDDWIFLIDEHRAFNRSSMKKFGVKVGEITLFFSKQAPLPQCESASNGKVSTNVHALKTSKAIQAYKF
jgi:hypothetical protein